MEPLAKPDVSSRLERIRARRAKPLPTTTSSPSDEVTTPVSSPTLSPLHPLSSEFKSSVPDSLKLSPPLSATRVPETEKTPEISSHLTSIQSSSFQSLGHSNPITGEGTPSSRLDRIKKWRQRSRESIDLIDTSEIREEETLHKKEQSDDTFDSGIDTAVLPTRFETRKDVLLSKTDSLPIERVQETEPTAKISTPPKLHKVSFSPPPPSMFSQSSDRTKSLQEEVLGELGMTDIPPTIPESSPPITPVQQTGDVFLLRDEQRSPMFVSPKQAEESLEASQRLELQKKREEERQKRLSSEPREEKSPGFMLMEKQETQHTKQAVSPVRTLMAAAAESTPLPSTRSPPGPDRDETYSLTLSQTTNTGLLEWDVENVVDWLHFIQLQHLEHLFRDRSVTGAKLNLITLKELQFMGVTNPDEQQTILHEVAELRMLWQVESETGSQMYEDISTGLASMSVKRKDLEKELDYHVAERLSKLEKIKIEQDARIDTSLTLLKEIQNPYPPEMDSVPSPPTPPTPQAEPQAPSVETTPKASGEERKRLSEGLEDLAEQSLISGSSRDTEIEADQQPVMITPEPSVQAPIQPPTLFRNESTETPNTPLLPPSAPHSFPEAWTVQDVCQWVDSLSLPQFVSLVRDNGIDGKELLSLDFINSKEFSNFSKHDQALLLSHVQDLSPTPSHSDPPHSRQSSRAHSEQTPAFVRPIREARSASDTGLLDHVLETGKEKQGKRGFLRKLIPKKFSSERLDKGDTTPELFSKSYVSDGEIAGNRSAKKLAGFFGVEARSPAIQSLFQPKEKAGQGLLRVYVSQVLPEATYKAVLVHPKDNCLQVLRLVMLKVGLQKEDINRFCLIEICATNHRIPERELGLHEFPLIVQTRHLDLPDPFHFELRTKPSTSLQFVINLPDLVRPHTLRIQISPITTARECVRLFQDRIPELNDPTLRLSIQAEGEVGHATRLREHEHPVMLTSQCLQGDQLLFSVSREPVTSEGRTTLELLDTIQDLEGAVRSYRVVEQKYSSLQEEHQLLLRKNRESVASAREGSSIDQLQELDVKYQKKIQLCRDQKEEIKSLKSHNEELHGKLSSLKSDLQDSKHAADTDISRLKKKLTEKKRDLSSNEQLQTLSDENAQLREELRKKTILVKELEKARSNADSEKGPGIYQLVADHPDYAFIGADLNISKTGPALGISIGRRPEPGTFIMKIIPGSVADKNGSLKVGDRLIEMNGIDISQTEHSTIVSLFKSLTTSVKLVVARKTERDILAQQKYEQKLASYEDLREKYQKLEEKIEEINQLRSELAEKENQINQLKDRQEINRIGTEITPLEAEYTRNYLDQLLSILEREAPHILQRMPPDIMPAISEGTEPTNDDEWC